MGGNKKSIAFTMPDDVAARARLIAERPPVYQSWSIDLQVGGTRGRCAPMNTGVFDGRWLSLHDLRSAVEALHAVRVAGERSLSPNLKLAGGPELFDHPEPVAVWVFLCSAEIGNEAFQNTEYSRLECTDGWRLGTDPDAGQLLSEFKDAGLKHVWFTLCGLEKTHDAVCGRSGAFAAIVTAMGRCGDAGIATGASIIVSKRNTKEIRELARTMRTLGAERFMQLYPLPGLGEGLVAEDSILEPEDVVGLPPQGLDIEWGQADFWADPAGFTEGALTRAAIQDPAQSAAQPPVEARRRNLWLRITADFEVLAPEARERADALRVGNLRADSASQVYEKLAGIAWPPDPPSDQELARRYGDTTSRILGGQWWVRRKWLQAWRIENGIRWLPLDCYE